MLVPEVNPEPIPSVRIQPVANQTTFGGGPGLSEENQEVQKIASQAGEISAFERIRADQTAIQQATAKLSAIHTDLLTNPQTGLPAYRGTNAMAGQDKIWTQYQKSSNEISDSLVGQQQKGAFNRIAIQMGDTFNQHVKAHVAQELDKHDATTFEALVNNKATESATTYGNAKALAFNNQLIDDATRARAERLGLDPQESDKLMRTVKTTYHETVLSQMVNDPAYLKQAKQYFSNYKDEMDVDSRDRVRQLLDVVPKQQEATSKKAQEEFYKNNEHQAFLDMFDGQMTLSEAQRRYRENQINQSTYNLLESRLSKPDANIMRSSMASDPDTFNSIRTAQLSGSKSPGEIQRMIGQAAVDKDITPEDGKYLLTINSEKPPTQRDQYIEAQANNLRDFGKRYFAESNFFGMQTNQDKTSQATEKLVNDFYNAVDKSKAQQGEQIDDLRDRVKQTAMQGRFPGLGNLEKAPDVVIDVKGNLIRLLQPEKHSQLKARYKITPASASKEDDE